MDLFEELDNKIKTVNKEENKKLLKEYNDFLKQLEDYPGSKTLSPIQIANRDKRFYLAKFILKNDLGDVNDINLHYTVIRQEKDFFDLYIMHGIDVNKNTPLVSSFDSGDKKLGYFFNILINHPKLDINKTDLNYTGDSEKNTYLHLAAMGANTIQFKAIIDKINPELLSFRNSKNRSAAFYAFEYGGKKKLKALLKHKSKLEKEDLQYASFKHFKIIKKHYNLETYEYLFMAKKEEVKNIIKEIIYLIEKDLLNYTLCEEFEDSRKESLYPYFEKIEAIDYKLATKLFSDNPSKEKTFIILNKIQKKVESFS